MNEENQMLELDPSLKVPSVEDALFEAPDPLQTPSKKKSYVQSSLLGKPSKTKKTGKKADAAFSPMLHGRHPLSKNHKKYNLNSATGRWVDDSGVEWEMEKREDRRIIFDRLHDKAEATK